MVFFLLLSGQHPAEEDVDRIIESGEAENIFQKAILTDQVRGGWALLPSMRNPSRLAPAGVPGVCRTQATLREKRQLLIST